MMQNLRFQDPMWCFLLVPLFLAVIIAVRRQRSAAVLYSSVQVLKTLPRTLALRFKRVLPWIRFLGLAGVVLALARPQYGIEDFRIRTEGIAIEMAIDRSGSMRALDFLLEEKRVNRLEVVKDVFRDFVAGDGDRLPGRPDDLIGLVAFGGFADSKSPLTLDHGALLAILDTIRIPEEIVDSRGRLLNQEEYMTAVGDAVALSVERLRESKAESKVLIFLSDGEHNAGVITPEDAAEAAKTFGVKIYAIGVGTNAREIPVEVTDRFGQKRIVMDNGMKYRLDEDTLKMLADTTGGKYFRVRDTEALKSVYAEIDGLEKTKTEDRLYTEYRELFQYFLFPGLALILIELLLSATRFRSLP